MKPICRLLAAIALLLAVFLPAYHTATAAGQAQPAVMPFRLVPGKSAGRLLLGATPDQIHAILGKPKQTRRGRGAPAGGGSRLLEEQWPGSKAQSNEYLPSAVVLYRGGKAVQIEVASPRFSAAQGVSVKTTFKEIRRRFPGLRVSEYHVPDAFEVYYDDVRQGIAFVVGGQDEILPEYHPDSIIIHPAGARVTPHFGAKPIRVTDDKTRK